MMEEPLQKRQNQDFEDLKHFISQQIISSNCQLRNEITTSNNQLRNDLKKDLTFEIDRKVDTMVENMNAAAALEASRVNCRFQLMEDTVEEQKTAVDNFISNQNDKMNKLREEVKQIREEGLSGNGAGEYKEDEILRRFYVWEDEKRRCYTAAFARFKNPDLIVKITNNAEEYYRIMEDNRIEPDVIRITDLMGDPASFIDSCEIIDGPRGRKILKCKVKLTGQDDDFSARKRKILMNRRRFKNIGAVDLDYEREWQFNSRWLIWKNELKVISSFSRTINGYDKLSIDTEEDTHLVVLAPAETTKLLKSETTIENLKKLASEQYFVTDGRLMKIPEPYLTQAIKRREEVEAKYSNPAASRGWGGRIVNTTSNQPTYSADESY